MLPSFYWSLLKKCYKMFHIYLEKHSITTVCHAVCVLRFL